MVGRLLSYWKGNFSGAMLNFGRVKFSLSTSTKPTTPNHALAHWKGCGLKGAILGAVDRREPHEKANKTRIGELSPNQQTNKNWKKKWWTWKKCRLTTLSKIFVGWASFYPQLIFSFWGCLAKSKKSYHHQLTRSPVRHPGAWAQRLKRSSASASWSESRLEKDDLKNWLGGCGFNPIWNICSSNWMISQVKKSGCCPRFPLVASYAFLFHHTIPIYSDPYQSSGVLEINRRFLAQNSQDSGTVWWRCLDRLNHTLSTLGEKPEFL